MISYEFWGVCWVGMLSGRFGCLMEASTISWDLDFLWVLGVVGFIEFFFVGWLSCFWVLKDALVFLKILFLLIKKKNYNNSSEIVFPYFPIIL